MNKYLIISLNYINNNNELYTLLRQVCIPSIKDYAKRMNIDFVLMNNNNAKYIGTGNQLQCIEYLDYYDKIMYLDGDCYIPKSFNVNLLDYVNNNEIGMLRALSPLYLKKQDCFINYPFVIFIIGKINKNLFISNDKDRKNKKEEIFINKIIDKNKKLIYVRDIPYIISRYLIPKYNDKICHLLCNDEKIEKYKPILINQLKKNCFKLW